MPDVEKHFGLRAAIPPMTARSTGVANEFLKRDGALGCLTQMQLQKLTYIAHGWTLAIADVPLVDDELQAWDYGPVFPELYDYTKLYGRQPVKRLIYENDNSSVLFFLGQESSRGAVCEARLSKIEAEIIDHVWRRYGSMSGIALSRLTHETNTPWFKTYVEGGGKNEKIEDNVVREHYLELARLAS